MEITPHTRIGPLLAAHPELEAVLVAAAPAFRNLNNPILRATVAKVATLEQAARVGGLPLAQLVGLLRQALGQRGPAADEPDTGTSADWPAWFQAGRVVATLDVHAILAAGGYPLAEARKALSAAPPGAIVELVSDFEPAPLLERAGQEGWAAACVRQGARYRTALRHPVPDRA